MITTPLRGVTEKTQEKIFDGPFEVHGIEGFYFIWCFQKKKIVLEKKRERCKNEILFIIWMV